MFDALTFVALLPFALSSGYLGVLAGLALQGRRANIPAASHPRRFAIVVPAHNEESTLPALLDSLNALAYPRDLVRVHVIADNCDDDTSGLARARGAEVHERFDPTHKAKGYAISWLLASPEFRARDHQAIVFIDADCIASPNLLKALNDHLGAGAEALQVYYDIRDADATPSLQLRQIALALVHLLRPAAKMRFGGSAGLKGTGMCFDRALAERLGWSAHGLAEDVEQHVQLIEAGVRVRFVREARVSGHMGRSLGGAHEQHKRWEAGRLHAMRAYVPRLLGRGLRTRDIAQIDTAIEQLVPPLSIVAAAVGGALAFAVVFDLAVTRLTALVSLGALVLYVSGGVIMLRPRPLALLRALVVAPLYVAWKIATYARALTVSRTAAWVRTTRDETL